MRRGETRAEKGVRVKQKEREGSERERERDRKRVRARESERERERKRERGVAWAAALPASSFATRRNCQFILSPAFHHLTQNRWVGGSHLRVLGICWLRVISKDTVGHGQ